MPLDENHPNAEKNLSPSELAMLKDLLNRDEPLTEEEQKQLADLLNKVANGHPLDATHPGVNNLSPDQQKELAELLRKADSGEGLTPEEKARLGQLQEIMAHGQPLDSHHPGIENLTEHEKDKLAALEDKALADLSPLEKAL